MRCHQRDRGSEAAVAMLAMIADAERIIEEARSTVKHARDVGLLVAGADAADKELYTSMMKARIAVHDMQPSGLEPEMKIIHATASKMIAESESALEELKFKRRGYFGFIALISIVVGLLIAKGRRLAP